MSLSAAAVISILEARYDYYSARIALSEAAAAAGLDAKGPFDGAAVKKLADAVATGHRAEEVAGALREAAPVGGGGKKPSAKKAAPAAEAPADDATHVGDEDKDDDEGGEATAASGGKSRRRK